MAKTIALQAVDLYRDGWSFNRIARHLDITERQAIDIVKDFCAPRICPRCGIWLEDDEEGELCDECKRELAENRVLVDD